jgi:NDP-4-keto-2,6-dideoxyhexose 3-C-methyltransferase
VGSLIERCRVCGNRELATVLDLGDQALTGIFPRSEADNPESMPLQLVKCRDESDEARCGLVQLAHSGDLRRMYGMDYGYRSGLNRAMVRHLRRKVAAIRRRVPLGDGDLVIDIGSNDATLLRAFDAPRPQLVGVDPTGEKFASYYPDHVRLIPDFFRADLVRGEIGDRRAKVITSIAMFYDLEDPLSFMRQVHEMLDDEGIWVFEQSYMPTMLDNTSYDTVCHEHLEYYGLAQLKWMADRAGFRILDVELNDVNGGSVSVTAAKYDSPLTGDDGGVAALLEQEVALGLRTLAPFEDFRDRVRQSRDELVGFLEGARARGETVLGYGASTKGNVILQYCGITPELLPCIAEVNEDKYGALTPGTFIPIVAEEEARARKPDYFLVLPWHFRAGIVEREAGFREAGGKLVFPLPSLDVV